MKPDIPRIEQVPDPLLDNVIQHWGFFTRQEIAEATKYKQLLMLDMDFGRHCSLHCPGCFRRINPVDEKGLPDMSYGEIRRVVDEACDLGLRTIKVCGAGETFEDSRLLRFAREIAERHLGLALFTKGHVIGSDDRVAEVFGREGVTSGEMLCRELFQLQVSVMLSYPTFDDRLVCYLVGEQPNSYGHQLKQAAELLASVGFNRTRPTRMAFVHAPLTKESIGNAFEVYQFARERNILPILAFYMVSGKQITSNFLERHDADETTKRMLFREVIAYNFAHGFQTKESVLRDGLSCMPGIHPCNQIAVGLYITANGNVLRCPGDPEHPLGNVREERLATIWHRCCNWRWQGVFNVGCPYKDGYTIPSDIYEDIRRDLCET